MTLKTLSLGGLQFVEAEQMVTSQYVTVRTGPGDNDFVNVLLGDFRTFMTELVDARIDSILDGGAGGSGPSIWPVARSLTLTGPVSGSATFDGSSNFSLATSIADGALTMAKVSGLTEALNTAASRHNTTFTGLTTLKGDLVPDLDNVHSLGAPDKMWRDVYIGPGSLYINGQKVLEENSGTIQMVADPNQNIAIQTAGSGDIELAPTGTGVIQLKGALQLLGGSKIRSSNGQQLQFDESVRFDRATDFAQTTRHLSGRLDILAATDDSSPQQVLRSETGQTLGALIYHRDNSWVGLRRYNASGSVEGELAVRGDRVSFNNQDLYHTGNLDPTTMGYLSAAVTEYGEAAGVNCNSFTVGTKCLVHSSNQNTPGDSATHWYVETLRINAGVGSGMALLQRAWSLSSDDFFFRRQIGGSWTTWRRVWSSATFNPTSKLDSNAVAASAAKWANARTISLTGAVTGSVQWDGSANASLSVTSALGIADVSGLQTALNDRALASQAWQRGTSGALLQNFSGDLNTLQGFAAVYAHANAANRPATASNVLNFGLDQHQAQMAFRNNAFWFRTQEAGGWNPWLTVYHSGNLDLSGYVSSARRILAGNGLSGGGALSSDQTLTLGTPSTISGATTNSVTTASHTHALSANLIAWDGVHPSSYVQNNATHAPDATQRLNAGFYQANNPTAGYPVNGTGAGWWHLMSSTHNNTSNYYAMQFAAQFDNPTELWYRNTGAVGTRAWHKIWNSGNITPLDVNNGGNVWNSLNVYAGGFATQTRLMNFGYNNGTPRWAKVIENDASLAFYGYNGSGGAPKRILHIAATHAGNEDQVTVGGRLRSLAGHFAATSTAAVLSSTSMLYFRANGEDSATGQSIMDGAGNWWMGGTVTATDFLLSSDRSLKREIVDLVVAKEGWLQPKTYLHLETDEIENGFVAQDVKKLYPRMVTKRADGKLAIKYPRITAALARQDLVLRDELRAQHKRIKQLEKLVKKLIGK